MNRWDATEIFRTLTNSIAKNGKIFYHGKYVELKSPAVRASIKIDDEFDPIKGSREFDFNDGMIFSDENDFIKVQHTNNYAVLKISDLLSIYDGRPLRKAKSKCAEKPLTATPTKLSLKNNKLAVRLLFGDEVIFQKEFFSRTKTQDVVEVVVSSHCFQKILAFSSKNCAKIGLRIIENGIQISVKNRDLDMLWQLPSI